MEVTKPEFIQLDSTHIDKWGLASDIELYQSQAWLLERTPPFTLDITLSKGVYRVRSEKGRFHSIESLGFSDIDVAEQFNSTLKGKVWSKQSLGHAMSVYSDAEWLVRLVDQFASQPTER